MKKFIIPFVIIGIVIGAYFLFSKNNLSPIGSKVTSKFNVIPDDAAIIFWSTRDSKPQTIMGPTGNLYVMNKDGGNINQITFEPYSYEHAAVSPDRTKVVAARKSDGLVKVWIFDLIEKTERELAPNLLQYGNGGVDWSIDNWIYFRGKNSDKFGDSEVYRIKPDSSSLEKLTDNSEMEVFDVSVSEDGTMVTHVGMVPFQNSQGETCGKPQIWVMNSDGSNHKMVDDGGDECGVYGLFPIGDYDPEFSPDNQYVVFSRVNTEVPPNFINSLKTAHDLWIASVNQDQSSRRLTQPGPISIIPDWYEDKILYTEFNEQENYIGLVTINPDGSGKKRLEGEYSNFWYGGRHGKWILK